MHRKLDVCYIIMNGAFLLSPCFLAQTIPFFRAPFFSLRWHMDVCWKGHRSATDQPGDLDLVTLPFWACFFTWKMNGLEQICVFQMPVMLSQKFAKNTNSQTFRSTRLEAYIHTHTHTHTHTHIYIFFFFLAVSGNKQDLNFPIRDWT